MAKSKKKSLPKKLKQIVRSAKTKKLMDKKSVGTGLRKKKR